MNKFVIIFLLLGCTTLAHAKFEIQTSTGYTSYKDGKTNNTFSDMTNHVFLGASFDSKDKFVIGQNISFIATQLKATTTDKLSTMELGPKFNYFLNNDKTFFIGLAWNPYAKGTRTVAGTDEKISGWSYLLSMGACAKLGNNFYIGASLNYHSLAVTQAVVGTTASTVSNNYTSLMPMLNLALRFR